MVKLVLRANGIKARQTLDEEASIKRGPTEGNGLGTLNVSGDIWNGEASLGTGLACLGRQ